MPTRITSKDNTRVRTLRSALNARRAGELIGVEGLHLIYEAQKSGLQLDTLFLRNDQAHIEDELPGSFAGEVILLPEAVFNSTTATETAQGVAALLQRPTRTYSPQPHDLMVFSAGLQDPGNLGTVLRSAEAFGASAVLLGEGTVDPWNGKCMRASAGACFRLPLISTSFQTLVEMRANGHRIVATVPHGGTPAHETDMSNGAILLIGNEGSGLPQSLLDIATDRVSIATTGPTESLNAAIAASLLLYESARQRLNTR